MDFASALANLEKSAEEASRSNNNNNNNNDRKRSRQAPFDPHRRGGPRRHPSPHNDRRQHDNNPSVSLDGLYRFGYRVAPYRPIPPPDTTAATPHRPKHICLLAITIDELPYEHIWRAWVTATATAALSQQPDKSNCRNNDIHVSLLCHAKHPSRVRSRWLQRRLLTQPPTLGRGKSFQDPVYHTHAPEWGRVEITRAMIDLLAAGMEIGQEQQSINQAANGGSSTPSGASNSKPTAADADIKNNSNNGPNRENDPRFSSRRFWIGSKWSEDCSTGEELPTHVPPVDKFIFISETCLPVTTLEECVEALFEDNKTKHKQSATVVSTSSGGADITTGAADGELKPASISSTTTDPVATAPAVINPWEVSWVNARNLNSPGTPKNKYERDQFNDLHRIIPQHCRWKADQWLVLSRPHAAAVLNIDQHIYNSRNQLWNSFCNINASDEMYFPTALGILNILTQDDNVDHKNRPQQVYKCPVTYTDWSEGMRNPACYTTGVSDFRKIAARARQQGCLLARKFAKSLVVPGVKPADAVVTGEITVDEWKTALKEIMGKEEKEKEMASSSLAATAGSS